jgi:hypothetical protein
MVKWVRFANLFDLNNSKSIQIQGIASTNAIEVYNNRADAWINVEIDGLGKIRTNALA